MKSKHLYLYTVNQELTKIVTKTETIGKRIFMCKPYINTSIQNLCYHI